MSNQNQKWSTLAPAIAQNGQQQSKLMDQQTADLAKYWQEKFLQSVNLEEFIRMEPSMRRTRIEHRLNELMRASPDKLPIGQYNQIVNYILNEALGYGPLAPLVADPTISEIMVNGPHVIYVERNGRLLQDFDVKFQDDDHLRNIVDRIVSRVGRRIDEASPMVDARLEDGSRVNVMIPPLSLDGSILTIRKFQRNPLQPEDLIRLGTLTEPMVQFLEACVRARLSILVSGGTGAGKTTLLNALAGWIGKEERVITVEDSAELKFHQQHPHVVRAETRPPNMQGAGQVTIRDLVRNALRMRPDRIIVGEVRGAEALDMLQAMNTGHEGSMTTVHANTPEDALRRLETMVMWAEGASALPLTAIREQIVSAIDIIVQVVRFPNGRKISAISEVQEMRRGEIIVKDLFRFDVFETDPTNGHVNGRFDATGVPPTKWEMLKTKGIRNLSKDIFIPSHFQSRFGDLLRDDAVTEIMINGLHDTRVERRNQGIMPVNLFFQSEAHLLSAINSIIAPLGKRLDARHPTVDARLPDGSRVNVVIPPVSQNGPVVTIRRFPKEPLMPLDLVEGRSMTPGMMEFLRSCVQAKFNILISGGTGSGKTTLLNALSSFIAQAPTIEDRRRHDERIITIEDVAELQIQHDHWLRLEARAADEFGEGQVTIRDLVVNALRMRPDRIIVGEVRGAEALDMLQAMNTGHEGSMTTIHANTPQDALYRLETMVSWAGTQLPSHTVKAQIVGALDIIIQANRLPDGLRRLTQVMEVVKDERDQVRLEPIYMHGSVHLGKAGDGEDHHRCIQPKPFCLGRMAARGIRWESISI